MNKKIIIIGILAIIGIALLVTAYKSSVSTKEHLLQDFSDFKMQYDEKKAQGYDVTEAEKFAGKAKQAFDRKEYKAANEILDDAFDALERAEKLSVIPDIVEEAKEELAQVKVASLYERVTDGALIGRSVDEVIDIFKETETDFIFRGWWRFYPCPESPSDSSGFFTPNQLVDATKKGYTYEHLENAITEIKKEVPDVIFCGAMGAQYMNAKERNPITGETFDRDETWEMALDPEKWDVSMSKYEFQEGFAKNHNWIGDGEVYDPDRVAFYYPDITNPDFQELFLSWAKKQIDCGADAIWIDFLFTQANILKELTGDPDHPAVVESYDAAYKIVDEIHNYGHSKYGKYIYVGSWSGVIKLPFTQHNLDFVTMTPSPDEIMNKNIDETTWETTITEITEKLGDIPIFAFIDWAGDGAPIAVFSQELDIEERIEMLKKMGAYFQSKGIIFVYPIHGGFMGDNAKILAFGKYKVYDCIAPEFTTYDVIKEVIRDTNT